MSSASAMAASAFKSGRRFPVSHRDTVTSDVPRRPPNASWERPRFVRHSAMKRRNGFLGPILSGIRITCLPSRFKSPLQKGRIGLLTVLPFWFSNGAWWEIIRYGVIENPTDTPRPLLPKSWAYRALRYRDGKQALAKSTPICCPKLPKKRGCPPRLFAPI